jgi:hypothetical protein
MCAGRRATIPVAKSDRGLPEIMRVITLVVALVALAGCSREFQPYAWLDYCNCTLADGGVAVDAENYICCHEECVGSNAPPVPDRTNYQCRAPAHFADAGCLNLACTCEPYTPSFCE